MIIKFINYTFINIIYSSIGPYNANNSINSLVMPNVGTFDTIKYLNEIKD